MLKAFLLVYILLSKWAFERYNKPFPVGNWTNTDKLYAVTYLQ